MIGPNHAGSIRTEFDGRWVGDARHRFNPDDVGFLLELTPPSGVSRVELRDSPVRTNGDLQDILFGIIRGTTSVEAVGVARVTEVARNGRGKVLTLWDQDLENALQELGYPEIDRTPYDSDARH